MLARRYARFSFFNVSERDDYCFLFAAELCKAAKSSSVVAESSGYSSRSASAAAAVMGNGQLTIESGCKGTTFL